MRSSLRLAAVGLATLCACSSQPPPGPAQPEEPAAPPLSLMNATVIAKTCPDVTRTNARAAESAIKKLVEPCTKIPGGDAHFTATMLPGGRIVLGSPDGDPTEGTVPTCVVKNQLTHKIQLRKPCEYRVYLEERSIAAPTASPAQPAPP